MSTKTVIISAAGVGKRMGAELPKQFLEINGKPVILHTLEKFLAFDPEIELIIVLAQDMIPTWNELVTRFNFKKEHKIAIGGSERFHSIQSGVKLATGDLVAVHDAVRPMVSQPVIASCFSKAEKFGAAVPVFDIAESMRKVDGENSKAVNRSEYKLVQTPQCFKLEILQKSYQQLYSPNFTDDATVAEFAGYKVHLVEGNRENVKLTTPHDLKLAELFLK